MKLIFVLPQLHRDDESGVTSVIRGTQSKDELIFLIDLSFTYSASTAFGPLRESVLTPLSEEEFTAPIRNA